MTRSAKVALIAAGLTLFATTALTQDAPKRAPVFQQLIDCKAIGDPGQRLACFDAAVVRLEEADLAGQVVVVDREKAREVRRQAFGFILPSLAIFERGEKEADIARLDSTVVRARQDPLGKWIVEIEGGAIWKQTESGDLYKSPKAGMKVEIKKGLLGAFFMNVDGQRAIKVERVK